MRARSATARSPSGGCHSPPEDGRRSPLPLARIQTFRHLRTRSQLLDDDVAVVFANDRFDVGEVVTPTHDEAVRLGSNRLVLADGEGDPLGARVLHALAREVDRRLLLHFA